MPKNVLKLIASLEDLSAEFCWHSSDHKSAAPVNCQRRTGGSADHRFLAVYGVENAVSALKRSGHASRRWKISPASKQKSACGMPSSCYQMISSLANTRLSFCHKHRSAKAEGDWKRSKSKPIDPAGLLPKVGGPAGYCGCCKRRNWGSEGGWKVMRRRRDQICREKSLIQPGGLLPRKRPHSITALMVETRLSLFRI